MKDGGAGSCLSDLSDDLLRHILSFAPSRERATTAVLSRRWLRLWRTSGEVYLDSRSFKDRGSSFLRGAEKALAAAAAHSHIRRLTFSIAEDSRISSSWSEANLMDALVSNPAARRVEELNIEVKALNTRCTVSFGTLPSQALRVLRLINCSAPPPCATTFFPMLVELDLEDCPVPLVDLQAIIDAAPQLSTLRLASSYIHIKRPIDVGYNEELVGQLFLPAVTDLVLADFGDWDVEARFELVVPRLQYFRYMGNIRQTYRLSLMPQASSKMIQVDLHLTYDYRMRYGNTPICNLFWKFIRNFKTAKLLNLKLDDFTMDDIALEDKASRDEILGGLSFDRLEQLELEAQYNPGVETSMVMLANLLHCCPMVRDLQLWFSKKHHKPWIESSIDKQAGLHFDKSVNSFRNRRSKSLVSLGGQNDVNYESFGIPGGLTGEHSISCLQSHLQRVSLHFSMDEPNCLEVQLAKFFTENAMVLQEMHIDDGSHEMLEHVNSSLTRWIANTQNGNKQLNV